MHKMKEIVLGILIIAVAVVGLGVWEHKIRSAVPQSDKPVVKIGVIYPLSGDAAIFGKAAKDAVDLFFDAFNRTNPYFYYQVIFEDNQLKAALTARIVNKMIAVDKVDAIISCYSNNSLVVSAAADKASVLHIGVATDPNVAKGDYNFLIASDPAEEARLLHDRIVADRAEKVAIVSINHQGFLTMVNHFKELAAQRKKIAVDGLHLVNADERDFRILIAKIKLKKPDMVLVFMSVPTADIFLKQYHEARVGIPFAGIETFSYLRHPELAEGMWYVDAARAGKDFIRRYEEKTGRLTTDYAEYMDAALQMITFGYEGARTKERAAVARYIVDHATGRETALGAVDVTPEGIINGRPILARVQDGKIIRMEE